MERLGIRLADGVSAFISDAGFKYIPKRQVFARKNARGFDEFFWASHTATDASGRLGQRYGLIVGVRHDLVENAVATLGLVYGEENKRWTTTVDSPLSTFPPDNDRSYTYFLSDKAADEDVASAASEIVSVFRRDAEPFYQRFAHLDHCAEKLNAGMGARSYWLVNNYENRMFRGIAATAFSGGRTDSVAAQWIEAGASVLTERALKVAEERVGRLLKALAATA
jgi:hypothetical protein